MEGKKSLPRYLNGGKRACTYLNLYIVPSKNGIQKDENRQTKELAENIRAKMVLSMNNKEHGFIPDFNSKADFIDHV